MHGSILLRYLICRHYSFRDLDEVSLQALKKYLIVSTSINGLLWGSLVWLLPAEWNIYSFVILLPILGISAAAMNLAAILPVYLSLVVPVVVQVVGGLLFVHAGNLVITALFFIFYAGVVTVALATNKMIKHVYELQFQLESVNSELVVQKKEADDANRSKSRFLAAASHDLRQPLHAMELFLGSLAQNTKDEKNSFLLSRMRTSLDGMQTMFASLLDISRFDAKVIEPRFGHVSVHELFNRLYLKFAGTAKEKGLQLRIRPCEGWLYSDPVLFERVLSNLLSNAIRYTDSGGILLACRKRGARIAVEVWDTGIGIPASELAHVFDEFHQLGNAERDRNKGVGLGLSIVRQIAQLLNVPVSVKSRPGRGSAFTVLVSPGAQVEAQVEPAEVAPVMNYSFEDLEVWVVDDDQDILDATQILLESWGCYTTVFSGLDDVKEVVANGQAAPELMISDFRLRHHVDGRDVIRFVQQSYGREMPALLITGDTAADRVIDATESGFLVLYKPVSPAILNRTMQELIGRKA